MKNTNVLVIGLGEIGKPLAELLKRKYNVFALDIKPKIIKKKIHVIHICYPGELKNFIPISINYIKKYNPLLVIINSTVLPGTTRSIYNETKISIAHSPIRGKHKSMIKDISRYTKFIGGINELSNRTASSHFEKIDIKTEIFPNPETTELAKILNTSYFGLLIAWVQEVERIGKLFKIDYKDMMKFTKEIDYFPQKDYFPGIIGGHCVIPNCNLLLKIIDSNFAKLIIDSNKRKKDDTKL